ncbi:hypothetical protein [Serratia entomophila]|uniref:hypothetical protein n=1 Tax=Serratia entomophila TaxID=42906 RepID=UPI00217C26CB|nr:hypothetical protein [Serratia entomophila]CAI0897272.1 Uncharacterised protein [Serratia entomophila]CAI1534588.1 Uncharacterised protein [Serratia entomophila]CAI1584463.1 Uncharacterised protein [Serratia entomophila]CAI1591117.1 Uncharacterised protein [Serratia entomophila]CAI1600548.1 Uncharacterised protein [Serratia entomophila]
MVNNNYSQENKRMSNIKWYKKWKIALFLTTSGIASFFYGEKMKSITPEMMEIKNIESSAIGFCRDVVTSYLKNNSPINFYITSLHVKSEKSDTGWWVAISQEFSVINEIGEKIENSYFCQVFPEGEMQIAFDD